MKRILSVILSVSMLLSSTAFADCKWADVKPVEGGYLYPAACHGKVGVALKDLDDKTAEAVALRKAIDLKDLTIVKADQRAEMWQNTTFKVEDRLNNLESASKTNQWIYYGLGILTVFAAGYAAHQIYGGNK